MPESVIQGKLITDTLVKRFHGRSRARELHLYNLKVDYISDSTTNIERALKMESVTSSFRLFIDKTRSSWLNCASRDDEAVYWDSIGHSEAVAVGNR